MYRSSALILIAAATVMGACARSPKPAVITGPDCRPLAAKVILQCWYGGRALALSQCEVGAEEPAGCGIGPDAVVYFNSGLDLSQTYATPDTTGSPRWIQFNVYRDATGRVGRIVYPVDRPSDPGHLRDERPFVEPTRAEP
jgi:hypothetical protein